MLLAMMPRNMILVAKENGVGGANENCWILLYICTRLKKKDFGRRKNKEYGMSPDFQNFRVVLFSLLHIVPILF